MEGSWSLTLASRDDSIVGVKLLPSLPPSSAFFFPKDIPQLLARLAKALVVVTIEGGVATTEVTEGGTTVLCEEPDARGEALGA